LEDEHVAVPTSEDFTVLGFGLLKGKHRFRRETSTTEAPNILSGPENADSRALLAAWEEQKLIEPLITLPERITGDHNDPRIRAGAALTKFQKPSRIEEGSNREMGLTESASSAMSLSSSATFYDAKADAWDRYFELEVISKPV
jgi:hypothetical protein